MQAGAQWPWFEKWLQQLKSLVELLRIPINREQLAGEAESEGFDSTVLQHQPPSMAKWRWCTLMLVMFWMRPTKSPSQSMIGSL
jgi:hypothetical protein